MLLEGPGRSDAGLMRKAHDESSGLTPVALKSGDPTGDTGRIAAPAAGVAGTLTVQQRLRLPLQHVRQQPQRTRGTREFRERVVDFVRQCL